MNEANGSGVAPAVVVEDVRESIEGMEVKGSGPEGATGAKEGKADVVSEEVCQSIKKGMRIVSDVEHTRTDGMVFKFELDLMYAVSKRKLKPTIIV